jgi:hypothetical protein
MIEVCTIGVYNTTEQSFFEALQTSEVDLFCDIRQRRAVRGGTYAYVNSTYLQSKLKALNIAYVHIKELAPTKAMRETQQTLDKQTKTAKRKRTELDDTFIQTYFEQILSNFNANTFVETVTPYQKICLFCVECLPTACHRSLVAAKLSQQLNIIVEHLMPCQAKES